MSKNKIILTFQQILQKKMIFVFLMGFASGLPLLLTSKTLQAWMTDANVDLTIIGIFALVGLPYTLKFLWSPIMDLWVPPFLGRRRGWMLISQIGVSISIIGIAFTKPNENQWIVAFFALLIAFFSASQDIIVDAYRRETLDDNELGIGSTLYIYGYRLAMLISGAVALFLADHIPWKVVYIIMAFSMIVGIATTLLSPEPDIKGKPPKSLKESILFPLIDFLKRKGAFEILLFILLYKLGDNIAGSLTTTFYLKIGFTKTEIAAIAKTLGLFSTLFGAFIGGVIILYMGINRSLWIFGILQALSTFSYAILVHTGPKNWALAGVISFEDISSGMGTAAFMAFMASITNKRFTATQYALLTSLSGVPRVLISTPAGFLVKHLGWTLFFILCGLIAIPGILLLLRIAPWQKKQN